MDAADSYITHKHSPLKRLTASKYVKCLSITAIILLMLLIALRVWTETAESSAHWTPEYEKIDLSSILSKDYLDKEDYHTIYTQTGLGRPAVDTLRIKGEANTIEFIQGQFFADPLITCAKNSFISNEETVITKGGSRMKGTAISVLEDGDILITPCSHTFGWRNGHAAIVVDSEKRLTLEAVLLGENSCLQSVDKWEFYPSFLVLRLSGVSANIRAEIAKNSLKQLIDIPYGFQAGLLTTKYSDTSLKNTQCAHLVWSAYKKFGYDIDSNKGSVVTPNNIATSPLLEIVQVYGINPDMLLVGKSQ